MPIRDSTSSSSARRPEYPGESVTPPGFSARRAHFEMLVNCRGREGRETRARGGARARGEVDALRQGNAGAVNREQKEDTDDHRFLDRYYAPFLRAGKSSGARLEHGRCRGREKSPVTRKKRAVCSRNATPLRRQCAFDFNLLRLFLRFLRFPLRITRPY